MNKKKIKECCPIIKSDDGAQDFIDWTKSINEDFERFFNGPAESKGEARTPRGCKNASR